MSDNFWTRTLPALYAGDLPPRVGDFVACAYMRHVSGFVVAEATKTHGWDLPAAVIDSLEKRPTRKWPTPAARDWRSPNRNGNCADQLPNAVGGRLNPTWVEWLMGFPEGWTDCECSETP